MKKHKFSEKFTQKVLTVHKISGILKKIVDKQQKRRTDLMKTNNNARIQNLMNAVVVKACAVNASLVQFAYYYFSYFT